LKFVELIFLSQEGITLFVDNFAFSELTSDLWSKIVCRLKGDCDESFRRRRISGEGQRQIISIESTILSTRPTVFDDFERKQWRLLYRGSRDGFATLNFHCKCHGKSNTATIIQITKGVLFGSFRLSRGIWTINGKQRTHGRVSFSVCAIHAIP
jgi:hypothetical protein